MLLSLMALVSSIIGVHVSVTQDWITSKILLNSTVPNTFKISAAALADIYISFALCWTLRSRMTGFKRTDNILQKLAVCMIHRGVLTTVIQIALMAAYLNSINQTKMTWVIFHCAGGKIYVNSMMAVLNARQHLKSGVSHISATFT
ncbi:uncharacterized protein C8Q71DRAFT_538394 [Rhodofomes roseus]|uniref:DUF6534 domain-containing protein n=1 Tax=Rhodofomes roseus TaxID=34475 RepID=A0ABQ8KKK3_9APHY|nr:uncharacterized protein C8Q71DRAFT_538394 [Rhodofomes roseus]KAH9838611.1 hypothetical protein C8Q71DRAFT_538394 [Rhodofomes roseus]